MTDYWDTVAQVIGMLGGFVALLTVAAALGQFISNYIERDE